MAMAITPIARIDTYPVQSVHLESDIVRIFYQIEVGAYEECMILEHWVRVVP